jgi:hypothetical protein
VPNRSKPKLAPDTVILGDWEDRFALEYSAARLKRPGRASDPGARARLAGSKPAVDLEDVLFRDLAADRARSRNAAIKLRLEQGFVWRGGGVGGNPGYARQRFVFSGLVSDEASILKLFVTKTPRARRLLTGDSKDLVESTDSKLLALDSAYVTTNQHMRGVLRVEIDNLPGSKSRMPAVAPACHSPISRSAMLMRGAGCTSRT